jgi:hypothetical protein
VSSGPNWTPPPTIRIKKKKGLFYSERIVQLMLRNHTSRLAFMQFKISRCGHVNNMTEHETRAPGRQAVASLRPSVSLAHSSDLSAGRDVTSRRCQLRLYSVEW